MKKQVFDRFLARIIALGRQVQSPFVGEPDIFRMWMRGGQIFSLSPAGVTEKSNIIRDLLKHANWSDRFSFDFIRDRVTPLLELVCHGDDAGVPFAFDAAIRDLEEFDERNTVFLPIVGIELQDHETWSVGPLTFHRATDAFLQQFCTTPIEVNYIRRDSNARVWAESTFVAEPGRAQTLAEELCDPVVDVLRFWMTWSAKPNSPVGIALEGEFADGSRTRLVRRADGSVIIDHSRTRGLAPLPIGKTLLENVQPIYCLMDFAIDPSSQSKFCGLIMHAVQLYGKGKVSPAGEDRILAYMMALEAFLNEKGIAISDSVSEGTVTFLRVAIEERLRLKKELKRIYGFRSQISHGEKIKDLQSADVQLLERTVIAFITEMIMKRDEFQSKHDLLSYLERKRIE